MTTLLLTLVLAAATPGGAATPGDARRDPAVVRFATFNVEVLDRAKLDRIDAAGHGADRQLRSAAEIVQRVRPDVLLINEIDFDDERRNAGLFVERYLAVGQSGQEPIDFPYVYFAPVNTGVPIGLDLDHDGAIDGPEDAYGFGRYPGQYGMALLSRLPIVEEAVRTFRELRWADVPGNHLPDGTNGTPAWYGPEAVARLRLSSKSHWDVPLRLGEAVVHVLASHPTPPVFDGDEDRNGRRNYDEIRLWADVLTGGDAAAYVVDDAGRAGGLDPRAAFVILGDLNADPFNATPYGGPAIAQLLGHPRVQDPHPRGAGGAEVEREYAGPPDQRTSEWGRLDYVLPSAGLEVRDAGVFWPAAGDPLARLVAGDEAASDHHLVWVDLAVARQMDQDSAQDQTAAPGPDK